MSQPEGLKKLKGISHFFAAVSYSIAGVRRLWEEAAFRHEIGAFLTIMVVFFAVGATLIHFGIMFLLFLLIIAFEAVNTAIEEIVDRVSPEISVFAKNAKDLGSFACSCLIAANGGFAAFVVITRLFDL
ncbi:diacylglycerol kinase [Rhizobium sp. CFBP 8762]|uniref:diacylglycerol kinase n=1 Tax=Rhizobium sp. CFBP 8762 TaxID=2775279 RepID=UPI00178181B3|nr:diacylglycerol kinase [Rhizobium sp. CFBP 8762]MBD8555856.1 diacylglycerol kinase [Rhizobium sp. CFBP 8762]